MKRLWYMAFTMVILALPAGQMSAGLRPTALERDPEEAFQKACARFVALEAKHDLLKGASKVKPTVERDKERLKSARFLFARNATSPGKPAAQAIDAAKPFFYVSMEVWLGRTQSPPGGLHEFAWKGQTYQMWVRVYGSDAALIRAVQKTVNEPLLRPFAPKK